MQKYTIIKGLFRKTIEADYTKLEPSGSTLLVKKISEKLSETVAIIPNNYLIIKK